jgi:DNA primase
MDDDVQKVKDRLNIADVVGQYIQLRKAGRTYTARCPFHKEKTPSFHVSPERGTFKCFGCGEGGDVFTFVQKIEGVDFAVALKMLAEKAGVELHQNFTRKAEHKEQDERLRDALEAAAAFFEAQLKEVREVGNYLYSRGVKPETVAHWRLGYAPPAWRSLTTHLRSMGFSEQEMLDAGLAIKPEGQDKEVYDRFRGRVMFPIFNPQSRVVAFSGRFFAKVPGSKEEGEPAKYVNSPETALFHKSRTLYGFDKAKAAIRRADCALLVEGQFDLILSHQSGLPFAVALSGTALTQEHLSLLGRLSKRLVLALDADQAGVRAGLKSAHMAIAQGFDVKVPEFPAGKDPADLASENPELLKAAVRTSKTAVEFFLDALQREAKDERSYAKLVQTQVLPLVRAVGSHIEQEQFIRLVARRLSVSEAAVRAELLKVGTRAPAHEHSGQEKESLPAAEELLPLEKKIGMLLFYFSEGSPWHEKLRALLGPRLETFRHELEGRAEELRMRFERELGEHTDEETIAGDVFGDIEREVGRQELKKKLLGTS